MKSLFSLLALCGLVFFAVPASAQDLTFRGCTDSAGRAVPSRLDTEAPTLVTYSRSWLTMQEYSWLG